MECPFDVEASEEDLVQPRRKPFSLAAALGYRLTRLLRPLVGRRRLLGWYLDLGRVFQRLSFELAGEMFGESYHSRRAGITPELMNRLVPANGDVLDIGCGVGRWCAMAAERAARVTGLDSSPEAIETARRSHGAANIEYRVADAEKTLRKSVDGRSFDLVLLFHVLEHIENVDGLLSELKLIARKLLIEVPDFESDLLNHVRRRLGRSFYSDADHVREYTASTLCLQLERCGFRVELVEARRGSIVVAAANATSSFCSKK